MNYVPTPLMLLWISGLQTGAKESSLDPSNIRLIGGATHCAGELQMNFNSKWKPVDDPRFDWNLRTADVICRRLNCGSAVSAKIKYMAHSREVWKVNASYVKSESVLRKYASMMSQPSSSSLEITCTEAVRLENGTSLCSGTVEVKADQSWSLVCKSDFDMQDAKVVCRELGCGAPLNFQGALNENVDALKGSKEYQCRGNESTLLDCGSYDAAGSACSPVQLTCSEPDIFRLVERGSYCAGILEMKLHGTWNPVDGLNKDLETATLVCRQLKCGSAVLKKEIMSSEAKNVWGMSSKIQSGSALREHVSVRAWHSSSRLEIACQGLLLQPVISISPSTDWVFKSSKFTISCFMQPVSEYPGFFELIFTSKTTRSYTQKAVNHTVHFPFPAADHSHEGNYSCVYHVYLMSHEFSTVSQSITLRISDSPTVFIIRLVGLVLTLALFLAIYFHKKVIRRQKDIALEDIGASNAERRPNDEAGFEESNL